MTDDQILVPPCVYHSDRPSEGFCNQCGQPVCAECFLSHGDRRLCPVCTVAAPKAPPNTAAVVFGIIAGALFLCLIAVVIAYSVSSRRAAAQQAAPQVAENTQPGYEYGLTGPAEGLTPPAMEFPNQIPINPPGAGFPTMPGQMPGQYPGQMPPGYPGTTPGMPPQMPAVPPPASLTPGSASAISAALAGHPGWVGKVTSHSADWKKATVSVGPSQKDLRLAVTMSWVPGYNSYQVMTESPVMKPPAATPPPPPSNGGGGSGGATLAPAAKPGESSARAAALANEPPGYMARVAAHTGDWKQVTVETGPPGSAPSMQYSFHWDTGIRQYVLDRASPPGTAAPSQPGE